jgi:hypothetical protein
MSVSNAENPYFFLSGALNSTSYSGSLWDVFNGTVFPVATADSGINLNLSPNNSVELSFVDYGQNVWLAMPIITQLLASNITRGVVTCTYPLSGQYDHLPRFLFYVAAVFAVLGRHLSWVAEAALGIVIAYSATAAVHLFVLLGTYGFGMPFTDGFPYSVNDASSFGDIDFFGIAPVVSLTVVLLTPMLHWSETFRSHSAKIVIQCWAVLMFAASIAFVALIREYGTEWNFDQIPSMAYCLSTEDFCQPVGTTDSGGIPYLETEEQYTRCQCTDLCGLLSPKSPLRTGTAMVPFLSSSSATNVIFGTSKLADRLPYIETALFSLWVFAILQGISALLGSNSTQDRIRNRIFKVLYGDFYTATCYFFKGERQERVLRKFSITPPDKTTTYWCIRYFIAKLVAAFIYLLRIFGMGFYPILFISTLAFCELFASAMPVSEPSSALGAWSAWVGAALIILSAMILAIYPSLRRKYERLKLWFQYDTSDRPLKVDKTALKPRTTMADFKQHVIFNLLHFIWLQKQRRRQFFAWWNDPIRNPYPEKQNLDNSSMIEPECRCISCKPASGDATWSINPQYEVEWDGVEHRKNDGNKEW